jgi:hypothetical protein
MRCRAVIAQKGGVAKTTTVANLAAAWGHAGCRVLVVDADPQFDLTRAFGQAPSQAPATLLDVMVGETTVDVAVIREVAPGVDLLASHRDLKRLELTLVSEVKREEYLAQALGGVAGYEEVLIDCPPNLGLLTVNALFAAPEVIVPVSMRDSAALQSAGEVRRTVATLAVAASTSRSTRSSAPWWIRAVWRTVPLPRRCRRSGCRSPRRRFLSWPRQECCGGRAAGRERSGQPGVRTPTVASRLSWRRARGPGILRR